MPALNKVRKRCVNGFIILFISGIFTPYFFYKFEVYPLSSFGMYTQLVLKTDFREYSIRSNDDTHDDVLADLGDGRFFLQYRIDQLKMEDLGLFKRNLKVELKRYFGKKLSKNDHRIFVVKYWKNFVATNYPSPELEIEIPLNEIAL